MHLAQINIARWKIPADDPRAAGFMDNLDRVNALAERAPGFVWRLTGDGNDATDIRAFEDDAFIVNMSVWESPEMLEEFVWNTVHRRIYERRHEWFEFADDQRFVMWWIAPGHVPTLDEAKERLAHLNAHGDSDHAFGWAHLPHIKLWQKRSCA